MKTVMIYQFPDYALKFPANATLIYAVIYTTSDQDGTSHTDAKSIAHKLGMSVGRVTHWIGYFRRNGYITFGNDEFAGCRTLILTNTKDDERLDYMIQDHIQDSIDEASAR